MPPKRPRHVIWITTDHMRFDCIGAYGNSGIHTPNLDWLAGRSVNFMNCFGQNPVCMPSRASFMTGLYPQQTQVTNNGYELPPDFPLTPARLFGPGGYTTAQIGKLHFQKHEDRDLDPGPSAHYGFDFFYLSEEPGCYEDAYMTWLRSEHPEMVETFRIARPTTPERLSDQGITSVLDAPWLMSHSGWVAQQTRRHFQGHGRRTNLMVHMGLYHPHPPLNPTRDMMAPYQGGKLPEPDLLNEQWQDKPAELGNMMQNHAKHDDEYFRNYRRHFYALVTGVDLAVGHLLDTLGEADALDDTLIVFTSDHGDMCGDHRMTGKHPSFFDELMHLPALFHWPAGLGTDRRDIGGLIEMVDLLPTMLELCGLAVPAPMAGQSCARGMLEGQPPQTRQDVLAYHGGGNAMLRTEDCKLIRYNASGNEVLYDLANDPGERVNQAENPDCRQKLEQMRLRMLRRSLAAGQSPRQFLGRY
jgi:arylsulfatase A-like enzyme